MVLPILPAAPLMSKVTLGPASRLVQAASSRLQRDGETGSVEGTKRLWYQCPKGQQCKFSRSGPVVGDAKHPIADSDIGNAFSKFVDNSRHITACRLY